MSERSFNSIQVEEEAERIKENNLEDDKSQGPMTTWPLLLCL